MVCSSCAIIMFKAFKMAILTSFGKVNLYSLIHYLLKIIRVAVQLLLDGNQTSVAENHTRFQGYVPVFPVVVHNIM